MTRASVWNVTTLVQNALVLRQTNAHHAQNIIILVMKITRAIHVTNPVTVAMVLMPANVHHARIIIILMRAILLMRVGV